MKVRKTKETPRFRFTMLVATGKKTAKTRTGQKKQQREGQDGGGREMTRNLAASAGQHTTSTGCRYRLYGPPVSGLPCHLHSAVPIGAPNQPSAVSQRGPPLEPGGWGEPTVGARRVESARRPPVAYDWCAVASVMTCSQVDRGAGQVQFATKNTLIRGPPNAKTDEDKRPPLASTAQARDRRKLDSCAEDHDLFMQVLVLSGSSSPNKRLC